jgi:hypothetical protein
MTETPENRRKMAISLHEQGLSLRRIAAELGMSKTQVSRDLEAVPSAVGQVAARRSPVARAVRRALRLGRPAETCGRCGELIPDVSDGFRDGDARLCGAACLELNRRGIVFVPEKEQPLRWVAGRSRRNALEAMEDARLDAQLDRIEVAADGGVLEYQQQSLLSRYQGPPSDRYGNTPSDHWLAGAGEFDDLGRRVQ